MKIIAEMEETAEYNAFVEKFKPKKTTDDCYTPPIVYDAIADYVADRYSLDREKFVRPFYPGGDYRAVEYPDDCIVVDNPPFSIMSQIVNDYMDAGIRFFLFCPYLTCLGIGRGRSGVTFVVTGSDITYENGATVKTSFVTNLEPGIRCRADPDLHAVIKDAGLRNRKLTAKPDLPKYSYPVHVVTSSMLGYMASHGVGFTVTEAESTFIRTLDTQRPAGKSIFGSGFLISEEAAAEKAAAEKAAAEKVAANVWSLSDREKKMIKSLSRYQQQRA